MINRDTKDIDLINNIKSGVNVNNSLNELDRRYSKLFYCVANKYIQKIESSSIEVLLDKELILGSAKYVIFQSVLSFDESKGVKFITHLGNRSRFFCLGQLKEDSSYVSIPDEAFDFKLNHSSNSYESTPLMIKGDFVRRIIEECDEFEDKRIKKIFELRYGSRPNKVMLWKNIYKKIPDSRNKNNHLTVQGCINIHNKAIKKIQQNLRKKYGKEAQSKMEENWRS